MPQPAGGLVLGCEIEKYGEETGRGFSLTPGDTQQGETARGAGPTNRWRRWRLVRVAPDTPGSPDRARIRAALESTARPGGRSHSDHHPASEQRNTVGKLSRSTLFRVRDRRIHPASRTACACANWAANARASRRSAVWRHGKSSNHSRSVRPAAKASTIMPTVTLIPRMQGLPPITAGSTVIRSNCRDCIVARPGEDFTPASGVR